MATDDTSVGAFDTEWLINFVLNFDLAVAGNLVAAWLISRFGRSRSKVTVIVADDDRLETAIPPPREHSGKNQNSAALDSEAYPKWNTTPLAMTSDDIVLGAEFERLTARLRLESVRGDIGAEE